VEPEPGVTYLDERSSGHIVYAMAGGQILLTLGGDQSTPFTWKVVKIDEEIIGLPEEPVWTPVAGPRTNLPGFYTFTFDVLVADESTALALVYSDEAGTIDQYFFVGIVTTRTGIQPR